MKAKVSIRFILIAMLGTCVPVVAAQEILIYGTIRQYEQKVPLPGAQVLLRSDNSRVDTLVTDSVGRYLFAVDLGKVIEVEYRYPGRLSKRVLIDGRGVPAKQAVGGFGMHIDIRLCLPVDGPELDFLHEPIGRASYSRRTRNMAWDMGYTAPRMARYKALFPDLYPTERDSITWLNWLREKGRISQR